METSTPALSDPRLDGVSFQIVRHGRVSSLKEAAAMRGVKPAAVIKTLVVRKDEGNYILALVPGNRSISWPKLRKHLGVRRVSMPSPEEARQATGYVRGTITPFGATSEWPVIADKLLVGKVISIGGGAPGVSITISADTVIDIVKADVADITVRLRAND